MPEVKPFAALRPRADAADRVCELPYDVISTEEARTQAAGNPLSFLHVSKPEIDLAVGTDPYSAAVYDRGHENLAHLVADGVLVRDVAPRFYLYRQTMGPLQQTGIVGVASCADYEAGLIKRHELTRIEKEDDRMRHIDALDAQTGPAFLVYRADDALDRLVARCAEAPPQVEWTARDGVGHAAWVIEDGRDLEFIERTFARMPCLYIADGHHRTAAAARVCRVRGGRGGSGHFLAVIFPHNQLRILAYHRVVKDLNGHTPATLWTRFESIFEPAPGLPDQPGAKHEVSLYMAGHWRKLRFRQRFIVGADPVDRLDVTLLQRHVLEPVLAIGDPRTSDRIGFVGGVRGTAELERLVDCGSSACAFALFPTVIEDLMVIADRGETMPPKSTWFEPKLRDGLFSHLLGRDEA